jgi:hypothetical protein
MPCSSETTCVRGKGGSEVQPGDSEPGMQGVESRQGRPIDALKPAHMCSVHML